MLLLINNHPLFNNYPQVLQELMKVFWNLNTDLWLAGEVTPIINQTCINLIILIFLKEIICKNLPCQILTRNNVNIN